MKVNRTNMMAKKYLILLLICISVPVLGQQTVTITLLHTNDIHSRVEPVDPNSSDTRIAGKGGYVRIGTYVEQMRNQTPNMLLFDIGDFSQGTPYYNIFRGEAEVQLMNAIGYDAATIGNHEFDFGLDNMARLFRMANFPIVCSNYDVTGTVLEGLVKPWLIMEKAGLKIGILGLGAPLEGLVAGENYKGVTYKDPFVTANEVAAHLRKEGCDVVICLSHLGLRNTIGDVALAQKSHNIDIILGGHSHTLMESPEVYRNLDGRDVYISQMGKNGIYVGRMDLTFEK